MVRRVKRFIAEEVVDDGIDYCDLGHYSLFFKEACMIMARCKLSKTETSVLLYVLGSMLPDGQVYISVPDVAKYIGYSRASVYNALVSLTTRKFLLRKSEEMTCGCKIYQVDLRNHDCFLINRELDDA